ncbi:PREDICTED: putative colon cancer-associated antigen SK1 [Mesitornis unicolor]|uniref:putative colon cancer-associated antigen SK1 n=1 Tax=Mesitornis unicolor TaxID=54374 RepID=UPI000528BF63|nr:PREDICTED: putative colon cancer-associated antigen SK1 [Mesitornis unicolor]
MRVGESGGSGEEPLRPPSPGSGPAGRVQLSPSADRRRQLRRPPQPKPPPPSLRISAPVASPAPGHALSPHLFLPLPFSAIPCAALQTPHRCCAFPPAPALSLPCPTEKGQGTSNRRHVHPHRV